MVRCSFPVMQKSVVLHVAGSGKAKSSKSEVSFLLSAYCFGTTVKSKNCKLSHIVS